MSTPSGDGGRLVTHFRGRQSQSVDIALAVLEEVARNGPGITAAQVSSNLNLPRSTTYRVVRNLVENEWLVRVPDLTGLALGHRLSELINVQAASRTDAASGQ
jgi:DNA-binding IclR family transcriptional regulator